MPGTEVIIGRPRSCQWMEDSRSDGWGTRGAVVMFRVELGAHTHGGWQWREDPREERQAVCTQLPSLQPCRPPGGVAQQSNLPDAPMMASSIFFLLSPS